MPQALGADDGGSQIFGFVGAPWMTTQTDYDVIIVGAGIAGAALGKRLADGGIRVLILERETAFRERLRGETLHPWGVAEARKLGVYYLLKESCGHETRYRTTRITGFPAAPRDMAATTPHAVGSLQFYHPEMQEVMLQAAQKAGADVRRGVVAGGFLPGPPPTVNANLPDGDRRFTAGLIVGADGRNAPSRKWASFPIQRDQDRMVIAAQMFTGLTASEDSVHSYSNPALGQFAFVFPLGRGRFRCYFGFYAQGTRAPPRGPNGVAEMILQSVACGVPESWFAVARPIGPLASFECAESWVPHPAQPGLALIGDAAATSDPTFGCGLSLALRDARVLGDHLVATADYDEAAARYAAEHDRYVASLHLQVDMMTRLLYEPGPIAAARRQQAFARIAEDARRRPDIAGLGPEWPAGPDPERELFGAIEPAATGAGTP